MTKQNSKVSLCHFLACLKYNYFMFSFADSLKRIIGKSQKCFDDARVSTTTIGTLTRHVVALQAALTGANRAIQLYESISFSPSCGISNEAKLVANWRILSR
jgi:hypothetical protein